MKEELNHQKDSEQLNFLTGTIKKSFHEKEKDRGVKTSPKFNDETVEPLRTQSLLENLLILDTETTGLEVKQGHRVIEIGAFLLNDRKNQMNIFPVT